MTLHTALAASALGASGWLLATSPSRAWPLLGAVAAGVELALAEGWIRLALHGPTLGLALGAALAVSGAVLWYQSAGKGPLTAASVLAFIGLLQTALAIQLRL